MDIGLQPTLQHAVDNGIEAYITSRRARIPGFIDRHFSFRGALALHRKTFGRDLYKHPVNLVWGVPVALGQGAADLLDKGRSAPHRHMAAADAAGDVDGPAPGTAMAALYRFAGTPLCAGGPCIAPRCAAGAHPGRTADCRAVRRVCDATAPRRGAARTSGQPWNGIWRSMAKPAAPSRNWPAA